VAVARNRKIGVDIEPLRPKIEAWSIVSQALTQREYAWWTALPTEARGRAFLSLWTRKEALLKATGVGLSVDPSLVEVLPAATLTDVPQLNAAHAWTFVELPLIGAVAFAVVTGKVEQLRLYDAR
jgi:4'-phosphopantetheinyl transferase